MDDDEIFLQALTNKLSQTHDVIALTSIGEVEQFLSQDPAPVDGFFVDLEMPDEGGVLWPLGGLSTIRVIRNHASFKEQLVAVLTGREADVNAVMCLKNGADDFIVKSISVAETAEDIERVLHHRVA